MMKNLFTFLAFFILFTNLAYSSEIAQREALASEVKYLLVKDDFIALDHLHKKLLTNDTRMPSGVWKLAIFYNQLAWFPNNNSDPKYWENLEQRALNWRKLAPQSTASMIFLAQIYLARAWNYRGYGFASSVRPEDWSKVNNYVEKAYKILQEDKTARKRDPSWYTAMISVLLLYPEHREEFNSTLREGMKLHSDYHEMYFKAVISLQPKWGGSIEAIESLADEAAKQTRKIEGEELYARIYWYVGDGLFEGRLFQDTNVSWDRMRTGFEDMIKRYPDPWNLNAYAYFACGAEDYKTMARVLNRVGDSLDFLTWGKYGKETYVRCLKLSANFSK